MPTANDNDIATLKNPASSVEDFKAILSQEQKTEQRHDIRVESSDIPADYPAIPTIT